MSAGNRWSDFRLASSLWSYGRPSDKGDPTDRNPERRNASPELGDSPRRNRDRDNREPYENISQGTAKPVGTMSDEQGLPIEDVGNMDSYEEVGEEDEEMQDFGPLEMFDSNASQAAFSSAPPAPEADMAVASSPVDRPKSKKKKKKSKKGAQELADEVPPAETAEESAAKSKRSKRKSAMGSADRSRPTEDENEAITQEQREEAATATGPSRKRKVEGSSDGKRRKKHKLDGDEEIHADDEVDHSSERPASKGDTEPNAFLRKGREKKNLSQVIAQDDSAANSSDPQASPSVAARRRRSQSRDARSRSNSITNGSNGHHRATEAVTQALDDMNVEDLAREAFNEHLNGAAAKAKAAEAVGEDEETDGGDRRAGDVYDIPDSPKKRPEPEEPEEPEEHEEPEEPEDNGRPKRSLRPRKAAAPKEIFNDPPSPKPRARAKRTVKKSAPRAPVRRIRRDSDEYDKPDVDVAAERAAKRRARMAGFKQGRFTDEEFARVKEVLDAFRGESNMSEHDVIEMLHAPGGTSAGGLHAELWTRIFAELPDRQRQKTINATRKKFHNFVARGTWTAEQEAELTALIGIHGTAWAKIASLINRHPEDLRDRYRNYIVCGTNQRKDTWEETEEQALMTYVIASMRMIDDMKAIQPDAQGLQKSYEELIDWQQVSESMGRTRSRLQCITKWKAMNLKASGADKLESSEPNAQISFSMEKARRQISQMPEEERFRLLLAINEASVDNDKKIPWQKLIDKPFRNTWSRVTQILLWFRFKQTVPGWENKTTRDVSQFLVDQFNQTGELPAIDTMPHDDVLEMQYLQSMAPTTGNARKSTDAKKSQNKSSEYVGNSDDEGQLETHEPMQNGEDLHGGMTLPGEMQIDPALMATAPEARMDDEPIITVATEGGPIGEELARGEPAQGASADGEPVDGGLADDVLQASAAANDTPAKKPRAPRTKGSAKKASKTMSQEDPIEDVELPPLPTEDAMADFDPSQLEDPVAQKKTPGRFRTHGSAIQLQAQDATALTESYSSDMDDMEDLPARVST